MGLLVRKLFKRKAVGGRLQTEGCGEDGVDFVLEAKGVKRILVGEAVDCRLKAVGE